MIKAWKSCFWFNNCFSVYIVCTFSNFIFTDETSFWINECPIYVCRPKATHPETSGFSSSLKQKLNLGCGISLRGATPFVTFKNNMNQSNYLEILAKYFLPIAVSRYVNNCILHQNNDPKHTSHIYREF